MAQDVAVLAPRVRHERRRRPDLHAQLRPLRNLIRPIRTLTSSLLPVQRTVPVFGSFRNASMLSASCSARSSALTSPVASYSNPAPYAACPTVPSESVFPIPFIVTGSTLLIMPSADSISTRVTGPSLPLQTMLSTFGARQERTVQTLENPA